MSQSAYLPDYKQIPSSALLACCDFDAHEKEWSRIIDTHPFNYKLAVFLPGCDLNTAHECLNASTLKYYNVEMPLSVLLEENFFKRHIQSDEQCLVMHSVDTRLDSDDVVTLDQKGQLLMSLTKETYQSFGMVARKQTRQDAKRQRYVVEINLKDKHFSMGSKMYDRLKWCFDNTLRQTFKMTAIFFSQATGQTHDIQWPAGVVVRQMSLDPKFEYVEHIDIPTFDNLRCSLSEKPDKNWQEHVLLAMEWLGLAFLKSNRIRSADKVPEFVSVYQAPTPQRENTAGTLVQWEGILPSSLARHTLVAIRKLLASPKLTVPWVALSLWGFRDSPQTWGSLQHHYVTNGENDYTFLLIPTLGDTERINTISYQMQGSHHLLK